MSQLAETVTLPAPVKSGQVPLEQLLSQRRSVRDFKDAVLTLTEVGQLLWAAQGITHPQGYRTAPSAGALYPLELYLLAGQVQGLKPGVYRYQSDKHALIQIHSEDRHRLLARAALQQNWLADAAAVIVFAADYVRTTRKYGERGKRYVHIEVGHAAQNLFLQAGALGLATVVVGAFEDDKVADILGLPAEEHPLLLMPVGK